MIRSAILLTAALLGLALPAQASHKVFVAQLKKTQESWKTALAELDQAGARGFARGVNKDAITLLFLAEAAPNSPALADAREVDPRATEVILVIEPRTDGKRFGVTRALPLTLQELDRLQRAPVKMRNTVVGALLREAWGEALAGIKDDKATIEARITPVIRVKLANGKPGPTIAGAAFDADDVDLLLGRTRTIQERVEAAQADTKLPPLRALSPKLAAQMRLALTAARKNHARDAQVWKHLNDLRSGKPRPFTAEDRTFLSKILGVGAASKKPAAVDAKAKSEDQGGILQKLDVQP